MILYALFLIASTSLAVFFISRGLDRKFMLALSACQWVVYSLILYVVSAVYRFTDGGDDYYYYALALEADSYRIGDILDPYRYAGRLEQPGYGIVLSVAQNVFHAGLGGLKLTNIAFYILITGIYGRIASELKGGRFGQLVAMFIAGLTPLWYYYIFLLKDMTIVALQGLALLGAVQIYKTGGRRGWFMTIVGSVAVIPLRSFLVVLNLSVAGFAAALIPPKDSASAIRKKRGANRRAGQINVRAIVSILGCFVLFLVATNSTLAQSLGLISQSRIISADTISAFAKDRFSESGISRVVFPILYLISESSGIQTLFSNSIITATRFRGLLALPWLMFFLPLLLVGIWNLAAGPDKRKLWRSPWIVVIGFCLAYLGVSWIVGDTTRWRLPDLPALTTIAALGYSQVSRRARAFLLCSWLFAVVAGAALFYFR